MGCCCSGDTVPPIPSTVRPDPGAEDVIKAAVARLGYFGASRDFGIWFEKRPDDSDEQKNSIWLWFNKGNVENGGRNEMCIDLENFHRSEGSEKGKVLYTALFQDKPNFQIMQRFANSGYGGSIFSGFFGSAAARDEQDDFYIHHATHSQKLQQCRQRPHFNHILDKCVVSKWSFNSQVHFKDGNLGRGEAYFYGAQPILEVYSKGTVVTSYYERHIPAENDHPARTEIDKCESEFVDVIDFRLTVNNLLITQWSVQGDTYQYGNNDVTIDTPLFGATLTGGWFARSTFLYNTKPGIDIDSALALLVGHVAMTEFSVAEIKNDLKVQTPHRPPPSNDAFRALDAALMCFTGINTTGSYVRGQNPSSRNNPMH